MELAQATDEGKSLNDNGVLDEFLIPFGEWMDQAVDWIATRATGALSVIEWPFQFLLDLIVDDILVKVPWWTVVVAMMLVAWLAQNGKVAIFTGVALTTCGLLGTEYWIETAKTIGFIGVAVILCVIVGIPIGIACGRIDGIWQVVRPVLDAMQVVHSFVYMLPFIYFWGIGTVSATMVTMIFAVPPLIRLTNLGIRQVPEDVVEAARAYGAPERRVLTDVQLPLARPAIMTGINQTLLLSISMLGIAAIMGAGGLGRLLFQALSTQSVVRGTSAGLAFFLVAVVLDRISQRDGESTGGLFRRIKMAWAHRSDPETLLDEAEAAKAAAVEESKKQESSYFAPVMAAERPGIMVAGVGALAMVVSVFLTWTSNAGKISGYSRRVDQLELEGQSFSGLSASGGSWFGYLVLVAGLIILGSIAKVMLRPGRGLRWLTTDGAAIAAFIGFLVAFGHFIAAPSDAAVDPGQGIGVYLALLGGLVAVIGTMMWIRVAPHSPLHPLPSGVAWGRVISGVIAVVFLTIGMFSAWSFDTRSDTVLSADDLARIDELKAQAVADPANAAVYAAEITTLQTTQQTNAKIILDGRTSEGAGLGIWALVLGVISLGVAVLSSGLAGLDDRFRWVGSTVLAGMGGGIFAICAAWIGTLARATDPNFVSGVGSFIALCAGFFVLASARPVLNEFRRTRVYADEPARTDAALAATVDLTVDETEPAPVG